MSWDDLVQQYERLVQPALHSGVIVVLAIVGRFVIKRLFLVLEPRVPVPPMVFGFLRRMVWVLSCVLVGYLLLTVWGLPLNTLLGMIGAALTMVAIGFVAVWSLLSNFMSAVVLMAFRPFRVGDEVEFSGEAVKGRVVDLTLLYTTLKTAEGDYFQVPNNMFFQKMFRCRAGKKRGDLREQLLRSEPAE